RARCVFVLLASSSTLISFLSLHDALPILGAIRLLEYSSGTRSSFTIIESRKTNNGNNQFFRIRLDLGVPQYEQRNFYVQFYTAHPGNGAYFRINQAYYHG